MKRSLFLGAILLVSGMTAFAQKGDINSAKTAYDQYDAIKQQPKLAAMSIDKAKVSIDKAFASGKVDADPNAWAVKALVYSALAGKDSTDASLAMLPTAVAAYNKAKELDTKGEQKSSLDKVNENLYSVYIQKAVREYQSGKYDQSFVTFEDAAKNATNGRDTTAIYYAAISAQNGATKAGDDAARKAGYKKAIDKYNQLLPTKFSYLQDVYSNLSILYAAAGDTTSAIKIAGEGAKRFPSNSQLATREIEFALMTHKEKETIEKIKGQFEKEPKNRVFPYYLGIAYNSMKDSKSSEEWYKKALEVDPSYAEATINLSGLIMNNGIDLYRKASAVPVSKQAEYAAAMKAANAEFDRALPYLQKATELDPKSELAWKNLKAYYDIKNDKAKSDEIKKKIESL